MLKIRLQRAGKKKQPIYRIVVANSQDPIKWKFIEKLWNYYPLVRDSEPSVSVLKDRVVYWISVWAQPSQTVARILSKNWVNECSKFIRKLTIKPKKEEQKESSSK